MAIRPYTYRGMPCRVAGQHATHYIAGKDSIANGGGILEWCYSAEDAAEMLEEMRQFRQFTGLRMAEWKEGGS